MDNPGISVIVPVYNVEKYLRECLNSIVGQTYKNLQIILVDDGSTDDSGKICDEYAERDGRIEVYHKENGGLSDARNFGIAKVKCGWVMFVDSDDYILPELCNELMKNMMISNADLAICDMIKFVDGQHFKTENRGKKGIEFDAKQGVTAYFYRRIPGYATGKIIKRECLTEDVFPVGKLFEDAFVVYKIIEKCQKIIALDEKLYCYRQRRGSIVNSVFSERQMDILEANEQALEHYKNSDEDILLSVYSRRFVSAVDVMRKIPFGWKNKQDKQYISDIIRKTRRYVLNDKNNSRFVRIMAAFSYISPSFLAALAKVRGIIKVGRV